MFFGLSGLQVWRCVDFIGLILPRKVGGGGKQKRKYLPKGEVSLSQSKVYGAYCLECWVPLPGVLTRIPGVASLSYLPHLSSYPGPSGRGPRADDDIAQNVNNKNIFFTPTISLQAHYPILGFTLKPIH